METISFITTSIEYSNWGLNLLTLATIFSLVFIFLQGVGIWAQNKEIWKNRSGQSVSVIVFAYMFFNTLSYSIYGIYKDSLVIFVSGIVSVLCIPLLFGLYKFKKISKLEYASLIFFCSTPFLAVLIPNKDILFTIFSSGTVVVSLYQPYEVLKNRCAGVVCKKNLILSTAASSYWLAYGLLISAPPLIIINPTLILIFSVTLILCFRYKNKPENNSRVCTNIK